MRKIIIRTFCTAAIYCLSFAQPSWAQNWQESGGDHFIVYYTRDESFAREVLRKAEGYYVRIASDLGYPRFTEFWTWAHRVKIYIYPDRDAFQKATNQPAWSAGAADYTNKVIMSYNCGKDFLDGFLPHEMAHLIFRDFVGFKGEVPLWLDEGVAQWMEPMKREKMKEAVKYYFDNGALFSVPALVGLDIRTVTGISNIGIDSIPDKDGKRRKLSPGGNDTVNIYYVEAVSLVEFMIKRYGTGRFTQFCRELRDGKKMNDALNSAYPGSIGRIEDLESGWVKYVSRE